MYKETEDINAIYTIVDSPDSNVYVSPENMAKMFNDKYGKNFSIKINNAVLSKFTEVTDESGKKAYTNYANSDTDGKTENIEISWKEFGKTLQIITSDKTYEVITDNPSETISEALSEKLKEIGYTVTKNDSYNLVWTLNSVGEQFTLKGGESRDFYVYTNVKDTFNMLTGDYPGRHPSEKINVSNRAYISKKVNNTEKIVGNIKVLVAQAIKREAYISMEVYDNETSKEFNNLNFNPKVGTILDYNLTFSHYGYGKYNNLPMVDDLSGTQVLLVPVSENPELSAYNFEKIYVTEKDGSQKEYYKLSKPGTYTNIKVGADEDGRIRTADNVTVEETNTGINTKIKWYFSETESDYYYIKTTLHTYIDNNLIKSANYNINNTVWMNNRTNDRIYATMSGGGTLIDFDKKTVRLDDNGKYDVENDHTIIGSGENVTYRLTLANNENKEFTVNGSDFVDILPTTCEKFNWERDVNVFIKYSQSGEVSTENIDSWVVEDNKIKWSSDTKINFKPNSSFEIYVTLIYPDNSQNVWSEYCDEMNGEEIENTFYVYADHRSVYHKLKDKSSAILQKGVYGVSRYSGYDFTEGSSRIYYNNRDYSYRAVEYYVVLYNNGNNRLYINDIYDELPKGFTYKGMIKNSKFNFFKTDPLETADSTDIDISPLTDISSTETDKIKYRRAIVTCEADGQTLKFGISAGSGENAVHLDKNNNRYYLKKNECIVFGYICDVGLTADTDDISINSIAMPYYDYLGVDMETVDSDTVSIHGHLNEQHTDQNDGTRKVEPAEEFSSKYKVYGYNQWLTSTVSVNRGNIVPGVTKYTESYIPADGSGTIPYGGNISSPFATVNWKVRLHNSGTHSLIDYTFEDEMPTPYAVVGSISMNVYDSNGTVTNTFSNILTFSGRTDDADFVTVSSSKGTVYTLPVNGDSVEIKYDNVTNNVIEVSLKRDKNHHETIKIRFKGPIFTIPENKGYADIFISGKNITTDYENTVYTNIATLKPNIQTFDSAAQGSIIYNDGKPYGVENYAPINVNFSFTTSAFKSVYEINNPTNKTVSNQSDNYITLQNRKNEFRYSLSVSNETKYAMQKLVIIDNLPEPNDTSPFNSTALRGSEFAVLLAENPDFSVKINYDDGTSKILQSNEYSVEFSSRTKFTDSDWNGTGTTGWLKNPENAKSIRIIINNPELVLPKSIVEFSFNAKAEGNVKAGQKAWNSFGYHYILNNDDKIELEAMPLAVGVQIPNVPSIQKKLVDLNGNKFISANDTDFSFIVYSGDRISSDTVNRNELIEVLNNAGRRYKEITLTVKAGESCSEKLKLEFENDKSFWLNNDKYTITETSISGNFKQTMWNNVSSSSVTFTYDAKADVTYICTNTYQNWSFELLKVDDENESKTLQGAEFAIYSPLQSDSMSDEDYNKLSVKPSKTYTDYNSNVWYLCDVKTTDSTGIIKWTDLLRDSYYLVETKAPDNYILNSTPSLITTVAKEQQLKITNHKMIVLPDTGKSGAIAFGFIGIGIILTMISIIFMKRFAKNIN